MFFKKNLIFILSSILFLNVTVAQQDVPRIISYQGVLVDANGKPVNRTQLIKFSFFDSPTGGAKLGNIKDRSLNVQGGIFFTILGNEASDILPAFDRPTWLEIETDNRTFRVPLTAAVYALNIPDNVVTSRKIKDGEVDLQDLAPGRTTGEILKWNGTEWLRGQDEGLRSVTVEQPIEGDGTSTDPLRVTIPSGVPIGTIVAYYGESLSPTLRNEGWALCNGGAIPTASDFDQMRNLATAAGHPGVYPNLQGYFLRGATENSAIDPDRNSRTGGSANLKIGSVQGDLIQAHIHALNFPTGGNATLCPSPATTGGNNFSHGHYGFETNDGRTTISGNPNSNVGSETRPKNVYVNYIIKAK